MVIEAAIVATAVELIRPYAAKVGKGLADKASDEVLEAGKKLLDWVKTKLGGAAKTAAEKLEAAPHNDDRATGLRLAIADELEAQPALAAEFAALVKEAPVVGETMTLTVSGQGAKVNQVKGNNNQVRNS